MWCCLILQTLPTQTLAQYLSHGLAARAGCHLNIASPLSQSSRSRELEIGSFGNPHASNDPLIRKYSEEQAIQYRALRISDDPILRDYYWQNPIKAGESAMKTGRVISCKRAASGNDIKVYVVPQRSSQNISIGPCVLSIPVNLVKLAHRQHIHVQCIVTETPDIDRYAQKSDHTEDGSRLVVRISGTDARGKEFDAFLQSSRMKAIARANSIYDLLVGRSHAESRGLPRRCYYTRAKGRGKDGGRVTIYTT